MNLKTCTFLFLLCAINLSWQSARAQSLEYPSLSDYLLPFKTDEIPFELEQDDQDRWKEIWLREGGSHKGKPVSVMEQGLGLKWIGLKPDKNGTPQKILFSFADKYITEIKGNQTTPGKIDLVQEKLVWSGGVESEALYSPKKKRRARRGRGKAIQFGKIQLPPISGRPHEYSLLLSDSLEKFLRRLSNPNLQVWSPSDKEFLHRFDNRKNSFMKVRYSSHCSAEEMSSLQEQFMQDVEPRLTCWAEQNPEGAVLLLAAFMQEPLVSCKTKQASHCGESTKPKEKSFFPTKPEMRFNVKDCEEDLEQTQLHEYLHLAGVSDGAEMEKAEAQAYSCGSHLPSLEFEGESEEFINDLQVETRLLLFRNIREQAQEKWGWTEGEKNYALGEICSKMGDKFCARRFFQLALENPGQTNIPLPEGGDVTLKTAAHFGLYNSISEDFQRMRELARYLVQDPSGELIKRHETDTHRSHDFFIAYTALEKVKANKGICNSQSDDKVSCEDLMTISRSPWFKGQ